MGTSTNNDLIKLIERYKTSILKVNPPESDPSRVLHYIRKLAKLPIGVEELHETGVGKTVNALRKHSGGIAEEATLLVGKWKLMVKKQDALEEKYEDDSQSNHDSSPECESMNESNSPTWKEETEKKKSKNNECDKPDFPSDTKVHLTTIKKVEPSERKRKLSDEKDKYIKKIKHKKINDDTEQLSSDCIKLEPSDSEMVDFNRSKVKKEVERSERRDTDEEKKKKKDKHDRQEEKKHKKEHDGKRHHKSSKHSSHRDEKHHRHHSKSSHSSYNERKEEESTESHKYKDKKSKSRSRPENDKKEKKEKRNSLEFSESESDKSKSKSKRNLDTMKVGDIADAGDTFGAALLSITPNMSSSSTLFRQTKSVDKEDNVSSPEGGSPQDKVKKERIKSEDDTFNVSPLERGSAQDKVNRGTIKSEEDTHNVSLPEEVSPQYKVNKERIKSEEDMYTSMTTTKNQRTKVFSGNKVTYTKFPTLFELCVRILQDNFDALEYTGGVPYDVLKPILEKVSVQQLYTFENYNPYLIGETDELWEFHAKKEFRKAERQEYETWRDLYLRCVEEREEKLQSLTENISQSIANSAPVRKTKLAYFDSVVKPPRNVVRSQAKHGTGNVSFKKSPKGPQPSPTAIQSVKERLSKDAMTPNAVHIATKPVLSVKKKKAPLMQKTLQLFKGLKR